MGYCPDVNGYVSEGAGENLFVIRNGIVSTTPKTAAILPGITRDTVMTLLSERVMKSGKISRESLYLADEILMCGTAAEVTPVRSVDGIAVGNGSRGPITGKYKTCSLVYLTEKPKTMGLVITG